MTKQIFISHSAHDREIAARIGGAIKALGFKVFNPALDIQAGADWRKTIIAALRKSDAVIVVLWSAHAWVGSWIGYEIGSAEALGKPVVVITPSTQPISDLPNDLATLRVVVTDPDSLEDAAREAVSRLTAELAA